jgi:cysteine-rich repeat protein
MKRKAFISFITGVIASLLIIPVASALGGWVANLNSEMFYDVQKMNDNPTWSETDLACSTGYMTHTYDLLTLNSSTRDYWTTVHSFAMVLDTTYDSSYMSGPGTPAVNDFLETVDTTNMFCTLGDDVYHSCGFDKDNDLGQVIASGSEWNGTTITYQNLGFLPGSPRGLVWRYSANDFGDTDETPWLHARNSSSQDPPQLVETIWMEPENYENYQTATTESYALVQHWYKNLNNNNWYTTYTEDVDSDNDNSTSDESFNVDPDGDRAYWYGAVGARLTFDDCVANVCENLNITSPTSISHENAGDTQSININVTDDAGDPWVGTYTYSSTNPTGNPATCEFRKPFVFPPWAPWTNPYVSTSKAVSARNCSPGEVIEVFENNYPNVCEDDLSIGDACIDLEIVGPTTISVAQLDTPVKISINSDAASGGNNSWDGLYEYDSDSTCAFAETLLDSQAGNAVTTYTTQNKIMWVTGCGEGATVTVTETNYSAVCNDSFTTEVSPPNFCGDGIQQEPNDAGFFEECDDGALNGTPGNACSATCELEETNFCGDGIQQEPNDAGFFEECDNGTNNGRPGNACSETCELEEIIIEDNFCGDGIRQEPNDAGFFEACDDGVLNGTDESTCSATCELPPSSEQCIGLVIDPGTINQGNLPVVASITSDPADWPGPWTWESRNQNNGELRGQFVAEGGTLVGNPIVTNDYSVSFFGGFENDVVTVVNTIDTSCSGSFNVIGDTTTTTGDTIPPSGIGGGNWCGDGFLNDGIINPPNSYGTNEECETPGEVDPVSGKYCNNSCQFEGACTNLQQIEPGPSVSTLNYTPNRLLRVQAKDEQGADWNDPAGPTYHWVVTSPVLHPNPGEFDDGVQAPSRSLKTDKNEVIFRGNPFLNTTVRVLSDRFQNSCTQNFSLRRVTTNDRLDKNVTTYNFGWFNVNPSSSINGSCFGADCDSNPLAHDFDFAFYQLDYKPDVNRTTSVTITDDIADGIYNSTYGGWIDFYKATSADPDEVQSWTDGNNMLLLNKETEERIELCEHDELTGERSTTDTCYENTIELSSGLELYNLTEDTVLIRYLGKVHNGGFTCETLSNEVCPVQGFRNTAETNTGLRASADLTVICPYLLTRNAGDVYLGSDLQSFDLSCYYDQENSDGLVLAKRLDFFSGFQSYINELQSDVQEIVFDLQTVWQRATIERVISERNAEAVTRYNRDLLDSYSFDDSQVIIKNLNDLNNDIQLQQLKTSKQNVYEIDGKDLVFALNQPVPEGAYTFIVRNADLRIRRNIVYQDIPESHGQFQVANLKDIPSIAFIVINGDIHVENNPPHQVVTKMAGVYYVQGGELSGDWTDPFTKLEIKGSVYGNINSLLENRTFAGPANYDHGNVVIRYDERILLNTPPGLEEYVDIESERVAR